MAIACRRSPSCRLSASARLQLDADGVAAQLRAPHRAARRIVVHAARGPGAELRPDLQRSRRPAGSARLIDLGGIPADTNIAFDAELPSYDIGNLRWGFGTDAWEAALFVNNLWDERAFLSIDRERGRSARVGYLTNPPRTYGVNFHMNF